MALVPIAMAVTGCGESAPTDPDAAVTGSESAAVDGEWRLVTRLADVLHLSQEQLAALDRLTDSWHERDREPGDAWRLAAGVQAILDPDQVAELAANAVRPMSEAAGRRGGRYQGEAGSRHDFAGPRPDVAGLGRTDEQHARIREILAAREPELRALREAVRAGTLDRDAARAQVEEIREETRARVEAVLTTEQKEALAARRAEAEVRREERRAELETRGAAVREARAEALRLSDEQKEQLAAARTERRSAFEEVLSEEQLRIVAVHRWLVSTAHEGGARPAESKDGAGRGPRPHGPHGGFFGS
jgi:hypothetical protein